MQMITICVQSEDSTKRVYSVLPSGRVWKEGKGSRSGRKGKGKRGEPEWR